MVKYVAFLRGVNVGGHRKVPMADLRQVVTGSVGVENLRSYIASGNLIFSSNSNAAELTRDIARAIKDRFEFDVPVLVMTGDMLHQVKENCPFPCDAGKHVHGYLSYDDPVPDWPKIETLKADTETLFVVDRTVWLHAPDGIGRSKLAAKLERLIGGEVTARNLNTLSKLVEMLGH